MDSFLAVYSDTQLVLTTPFQSASASYAYSIIRKFTSLSAWVDCIDGTTACPGVASSNLVTGRRREVGVFYKDGILTLGGTQNIDSVTTDPTHDITLTADHGNRHYGIPGTGVVINLNANSIRPGAAYITVEWLQFRNGSPRAFHLSSVDATPNKLVVRYCYFESTVGAPLAWFSAGAHDADVYNNVFVGSSDAVDIDTNTVNVYNNTMYNVGTAVVAVGGTVTIRNNIAHTCSPCYNAPGRTAASSNNLSSDGSAASVNPGGNNALWNNVPLANMNFVNAAAGNLHILAGSRAENNGADLSASFVTDIDLTVRQAPWEMGVDDLSLTTAVTLSSFTASGLDGRVELRWETASELQNLGFHLYRSESEDGPYARITSSLITGLGSAPTGRSYSYADAGLVNGRTYFYKLEDVETTGRTELHGPVSATPSDSRAGGGGAPPSGSGSLAYGDPKGVVLRELERSPRHVVLELLTPGFYASPAEDGRVRLSIPGFESLSRPGEPAVPARRALVEAMAGRKILLASVVSSDILRFPGLRPTVEGVPEIAVGEDGSVLPSRRPVREGRSLRGLFPAEWARLGGSAFQGETKKAEMLLFPLRFDGTSGQLELSRRLLVRLEFSGTERGERSLGGSRGKKARERRSSRTNEVVAQFVVKEKGLYRVSYEEVFPLPRSARAISTGTLRLSRQGENVALHVEPEPGIFGPGSSLFFLSEGEKLNPYGDAVYELETHQPGLLMPVEKLLSPVGVVTEHFQTLEREENKYYQAGLLDAPDLWLWDVVVSPDTKSYSFTVDHLSSSSSSARLSVLLQGASDFEGVSDHHVRVGVNGSVVGEGSWDGKLPKTLELEVGPGLLREGENSLEIENVGDTGAAYSMVFLNRFSLSYPRTLVALEGKLEGRFAFSGQAEVQGLSSSSVLLDTTETPRWLVGASATPTGLAFPVQAGRSYLATAAVLHPTVRLLETSSLKSTSNRADYLLLAPRDFLPAAQPLLDRRGSEGLVTKAVSLEEIYEQFGHGEVSPEAIKEFLEYAYQSWASPSPRYVLLLGDASYDPKDYLKTGVLNRLPGFPAKTSFLWTVSDPAYASVNGEDLIPDLAIGRLPAGSFVEAQALVQKVLAFENGGGNFQGQAVLVADNADLGGNFEADADEIASGVLASRSPQKIYYSQRGSSTRAAIHDAFDQGASLLSYVGHGGTVVWASENFFNYQDVQTLAPQPQQPLLLTMNCLNGFFHFPPLNSLSEGLLKAEGRGAIGAFSPSGLSVDEAAHLYHKAVLGEVLSGRHERMGDAVLAAQETYARSGAFPELLGIYHLLGDPALRIR